MERNDLARGVFVSVLLPIAIVSTGCATAVGEAGRSEEALSESNCPADTPDVLAPAPDQRLRSIVIGDGVQIYDCTTLGWVFRAPEAVLLDPGGAVVGTHYAGPSWEADDGSIIRAARVSGATVDPDSIPWLLLGVVSQSGDGRFANVSNIQRLNTVGGKAPASGCDATTIGAVARVPYTADYFLYQTDNGGTGNNPQCR